MSPRLLRWAPSWVLRRARAVYDYMVMLGVNPDQLEMISYGTERPAVSGDSEEAWALNRRDNFNVIAR